MPLDNTKILLLNVNRDGWHSGNMIYDMQSVGMACDVINYGPGWPNYSTTDLREIISMLYGSGKPDVIYSYFTPNERVSDVYMEHYKIPESLRYFPTHFQDVKGVLKIFALSDFWARSPQKFSSDLKDSSFQYCFCCFTPPYSNPRDFFSFFDANIRSEIKFVAHPRCIDPECFRDYGQPKVHDVITLGSMCRFYPLRSYMNSYLTENHIKMGIKYKNYSHCGTNFNHSSFVREDYAKAINSSKMLLSCGGRYHLAFNKIFEAFGCHSVYIGEKPYGEKELYLEDGKNYISVTKDDFVDKITYYLNRPYDISSIVKNAYETFLEHHTLEARAKYFVKILKSIL